MQRFHLYHVPVWSFFSADLYRDVGLRWGGTGLLYLFLLLAVCWIPVIVRVQARIAALADREAPKLVEQLPTITIEDGRASIEEEQPYYIYLPEAGSERPLAVIDTTGEITSLEATDAKVLLTQTHLYMREEGGQVRVQSLAEVDGVVLDRQRVYGVIDTFTTWIGLALYPLALIGSYAFRIIQALIYAAVGMAFAQNRRLDLSYAATLRLAVAAVTPVIVVKTLLTLLRVDLPALIAWPLFIAAALVYLYLGVGACAGEETPLEMAPGPGRAGPDEGGSREM
jgi:hypothetical protein